MPELCRFFGIVIRVYFDDHPPPHFHAEYGEHEALIEIRTLAVIAGNLPSRALGMVIEWASTRQVELNQAWGKAESLESPGKISPLK